VSRGPTGSCNAAGAGTDDDEVEVVSQGSFLG
jgi:hypothetical protein